VGAGHNRLHSCSATRCAPPDRFPGFEAAFRTPWPLQPAAEIPISTSDISKSLRISDRHVGIFEAVSHFEGAIRNKIRMDDVAVDLWFVIFPKKYIFSGGHSREFLLPNGSASSAGLIRIARRLRSQPSLFEEDMEEAKIYAYDLDFHNQLKARLFDTKAVVQVVRETSLDQSGLLSKEAADFKIRQQSHGT
jgi:hypothetical protein